MDSVVPQRVRMICVAGMIAGLLIVGLFAWGYHLIQVTARTTAEREGAAKAAQVATQAAVKALEDADPKRPAPPPLPVAITKIQTSWTEGCLWRVDFELDVHRDIKRDYTWTFINSTSRLQLEIRPIRNSAGSTISLQGRGINPVGHYPNRFWEFQPIFGVSGTLISTITYPTPEWVEPGRTGMVAYVDFDWSHPPERCWSPPQKTGDAGHLGIESLALRDNP